MRHDLLRRLLRWAGREPVVLGALLLAAGATWAFVEIADEVIEGDAHAIDTSILLAMRTADPADPVGPGWVEEMMRDFTALGGVAVLIVIMAAAIGYVLLMHKRWTAVTLLTATLGGVLVSNLLKFGFDRPRPDLISHGSVVYTASFPSGHSMMAAVVYLTLGALLARIHPNIRMKAYLLGVALFVTVLVGVSRVYLGVHWPSDVLAGWVAGAGWALLAWAAVSVLETRRRDGRN